jgi:hypothetical protein
MRIIIIIAVITFVALGCSKKDDEVPASLPESEVAQGQEADNSAGGSEVDPVFNDYEYPASKFESTFTSGNTVSAIYNSPDNFTKVVEFYKKKFPDAPPQSGTTVYFGKANADGSSFTVTLTQMDDNTQIILKQEKKL